MFGDLLARPAVLAPALLVVGYVLYQLFRPSKLPDIPIIGSRPGEWFPLMRARWRNVKGMKSAIQLAYDQYKDQACIIPVAGATDFVMLPVREIQWLVDQPDSDFNMHEQTREALQLDYTVMDAQLTRTIAHHKLISGVLTRETGNLVPDLIDEIRFSVDKLWGTDTENFKTISVFSVMQRIIGHATNRIFVGLPLCRDPALLDTGVAFARDVPLSSRLLRFVWKPVRPLAALLVTLPNRVHTNRFCQIIRPEVQRRLREYDARRADPETKAAADDGGEPNDFLQWLLRQARELGDPYLGRPDTLAGRVLLLNFASIHTSSFAVTHALLDLASSRQAHFDELRAEIASALTEQGGGGGGGGGGRWNKRALAAMPKLDSVFRESQRLNSFITLATNRLVVNPAGVTTPSGVHLPRGTVVCAPSYPVLHDPAVYPDPETFRPFRFSEKRAAAGDKGGEESGSGGGSGGGESYVQRARQAFATTSPEFMAFGHGRHACPGRFFASAELRLMLAYLVMNYDFEIQDERPRNIWFGASRLPPMRATIRVRRRRDGGGGVDGSG
ncbi:ent-kaurene oxidase [Biscogniauxia marginata]|nr:ent-kaurene oxidase [Biscogniauxia marginata]